MFSSSILIAEYYRYHGRHTYIKYCLLHHRQAENKANGSTDDLEAVLKNATLADGTAEPDDGGRSATGALISEPRARDIKINAFSLALQGKVLVEDTVIELNQGGRYGLLGRNGCGKSTLLKCLAAREIPIPPHFDVYLLDHEAGLRGANIQHLLIFHSIRIFATEVSAIFFIINTNYV